MVTAFGKRPVMAPQRLQAACQSRMSNAERVHESDVSNRDVTLNHANAVNTA